MSRVGRIINAAKWSRVTSLLSSTKGTITRGGSSVESQLFVEPTIVRDVPLDDALLDAEVFGPILPVLRCKDMTDISATLKSISPSPLCFYVFSEDLEEANNMVNTVQCGSAAINDVMAQMVPTSMPFGGIGESGFGAYRGKASIDTFSHKQSVVSVPTSNEFENMLEWRYPYSESKDTVQFLKDNMKAKLS
jgi:acyl-CoA reductase-like NAD-dependent aldehyde dehydrogenase